MVIINDPKDFGALIRNIRKEQKLTQPELAALAGVGIRFIVDLEKGKKNCQIGKAMYVLHMLGVQLTANEDAK